MFHKSLTNVNRHIYINFFKLSNFSTSGVYNRKRKVNSNDQVKKYM